MSFREDVDALNARFIEAFKRRDPVGACVDAYTEDAVFLAAGSEPVRGRAAITAAIAEYWKSSFEPKGATTLIAEAEGNLGYAIETVESNTGAGIVLLVLRRDAQGRWRICAEAFLEK